MVDTCGKEPQETHESRPLGMPHSVAMRPVTTTAAIVEPERSPHPEQATAGLFGRLEAGPGRHALVAFVAFLVASVVLFGLPVLSDFRHRYVGPASHPDPGFFIWAMAWWPHAIIHGLNPMWSRAVWAPAGYNLAWATGAPGLSLLLLPVTLTAGPVVSYNVLALLAAPLSGTAAYLLCRHATGSFWPSLLGGYVFGFSTYEISHVGINPNLGVAFLVPFAIHLVLLRVKRAIAPQPFVALLTLVLVLQFLISIEVFATLAVFGGATMAIAFVAMGPERRRALAATSGQVTLSFVMAGVVVGPYLYYVLAFGIPRRVPIGADLLSFVLPRSLTLIRVPAFDRIVQRFPGSLVENTAYLGPPLIVIVVLFAITRWRTRAGTLLLSSFAVVLVASLGETLYVGGRPTISLPWRAIGTLPILDNAFPRRFTMYVFLVSAVMLALWVSTPRRSARSTKAAWVLALLVPAFLFPSYSPFYLHGEVNVPRFFEAGTYRHFIRPGANILIVPERGTDSFPQARSMMIQAETGFSFRMVVAYTGPHPPEYHRSVIIQALTRGRIPPVAPSQFREFLHSHRVTAIVLDRGSRLLPGMTALVGRPPVAVQDVLLYEIGPGLSP